MSCGGSSKTQHPNHNLMQIVRVGKTAKEDLVVRWCTRCGAVVVDADVDRQIQPGKIMPMMFPGILYSKE